MISDQTKAAAIDRAAKDYKPFAAVPTAILRNYHDRSAEEVDKWERSLAGHVQGVISAGKLLETTKHDLQLIQSELESRGDFDDEQN